MVAFTYAAFAATDVAALRGAERALVVLDTARVRAYRTTAPDLEGVPKDAGVVVWLKDGRATWLADASALPPGESGEVVIVQPIKGAPASAANAPPAGSKPGDAPFTGMSFAPLFDNGQVSVIRARMDVGAREGLHTHGSDTIVVHLSGGQIEDTANGKTVVNRWKPGDVEFEAKGSSHSARNISDAVDVVLVVLKP